MPLLTETLLFLLSSLIKLLGTQTEVDNNTNTVIKVADVPLFSQWQITNSSNRGYAALEQCRGYTGNITASFTYGN